MWSKIFSKFKCNNAHAHSFGRKTLSVSNAYPFHITCFFCLNFFLPILWWIGAKFYVLFACHSLYVFIHCELIHNIPYWTDVGLARKLSPTVQRWQSIFVYTVAKSHTSASCVCSGNQDFQFVYFICVYCAQIMLLLGILFFLLSSNFPLCHSKKKEKKQNTHAYDSMKCGCLQRMKIKLTIASSWTLLMILCDLSRYKGKKKTPKC